MTRAEVEKLFEEIREQGRLTSSITIEREYVDERIRMTLLPPGIAWEVLIEAWMCKPPKRYFYCVSPHRMWQQEWYVYQAEVADRMKRADEEMEKLFPQAAALRRSGKLKAHSKTT